jgi:hypothetical protein
MEIIVRLSRMPSLAYSICLLMPRQRYGMALFGPQGIGGRHRAEACRRSIISLDVLALAFYCRRARWPETYDLSKLTNPHLWLDAFIAWRNLKKRASVM